MPIFKIFQGLSKSETAKIFDLGMILAIAEGTVLFRKGEIGHEMYVLLSGRMGIVDERGAEATDIAELGPGELFGEMAIFEESHKRSATGIARDFSQVLVLSEEMLKQFVQKKVPRRFLANIIGILCHRLRLTNSMYLISKYGDKIAAETE